MSSWREQTLFNHKDINLWKKQLQIRCQEMNLQTIPFKFLRKKIFNIIASAITVLRNVNSKKISSVIKLGLGRLVGVLSVASLRKTCRSITLFFFFKLYLIAFREKWTLFSLLQCPTILYFPTPGYCHLTEVRGKYL